MKKSTLTLAGGIAAVVATALTLGACEEVIYVEVPVPNPVPNPVPVEVERCTPEVCENLECPTCAQERHVCDKDLWDCVIATGHSMRAVIEASRESCEERDCQNPDTCVGRVRLAYDNAVFELWGERGGKVREINDNNMDIFIPAILDGATGRGYTPCLTDEERQAGTDAAMAQIALNELAKEQLLRHAKVAATCFP